MEILLTNEEYDFLVTFLSNKNIPKSIFEDGAIPKIIIDEDRALEIREWLGDEIIYHFDADYNVTETGRVIESLIDKFFPTDEG